MIINSLMKNFIKLVNKLDGFNFNFIVDELEEYCFILKKV